MRASKRELALQAAKEIVQRDGVTALSYESVAAEAGLTKGGLIYHFPSREEMLTALHEYVAGQWESCLMDEARHAEPQHMATPTPSSQETYPPEDPNERFAAYTRASQNPDRAELLLILEATKDAEMNAIWEEIYQRWAPAPPQHADQPDADELRAFIARLAADGLWFYEALCSGDIDPALRQRVVEEIIDLGHVPSEQNHQDNTADDVEAS